MLVFAALYFLAASVGLAFRTEPEKFALFWPPNGLLLGLLLVSDRTGRRGVTAVAAVVCAAANLLGGNSLVVSAAFTVINIGEPWAAVWLFSRLRPGPYRLESPGEVFTLFVGTLAVCSATALYGAAVVVVGLGAPNYAAVWLDFLLSDALGVMLVTPVVLAWAAPGRSGWKLPPFWRCAEAAALLVTVLALTWIVFSPDSPGQFHLIAYPFPLFPLLLWAAFRFGSRGATAAMLLFSLVAIWHTGRGHGPFSRPNMPEPLRLILVQLFLNVMGLGSLALAAALNDRQRVEDALRESERRYREVMETIEEVFWVASPDLSRLLYVSPAYEQLWGRPLDSLGDDTGGFLAGIHTGDRGRVAVALVAPAGAVEEEFRVVRPDGSVRWVHTRAFPIRDEGGRVLRVVGISLDVTARREAEVAREELIGVLQQAVTEIRTLRGLIPICAWCKNIRDDAGFWQRLEQYLCTHTEAKFTHGICPACYERQAELVPVPSDE